MASRNNLQRFQNIKAQSMTVDVTSAVTSIQYADDIYLQLVWTGTPNGTFNVQVSNSYEQDNWGNITSTGSWDSVTLSPQPVAAGAPGSWSINLSNLGSPWIRVTYTHSSSTGTLNGWISTKAK